MVSIVFGYFVDVYRQNLAQFLQGGSREFSSCRAHSRVLVARDLFPNVFQQLSFLAAWALGLRGILIALSRLIVFQVVPYFLILVCGIQASTTASP